MNKPPSVRVAGWAFVLLAALGVFLVARYWSASVPVGRALGVFAFLICLLGFGVVWLAGTAAHRARLAGAVKHLEETADGMTFRRLAALAGPRLHLAPHGAPEPMVAEDCEFCKRPQGILWCAGCKLWFCWEHALNHVRMCKGEMHPINRAKWLLAGKPR